MHMKRHHSMLAMGYGLFQAASSTGYLSAMGTVETNLGFVTQLPFMAANGLANAALMLTVMLLARHGLIPRLRVPYALGATLMAGAVIAGFATPALSIAGSTTASLAIGVVRGSGSALLTLAWLELFIVLAGDACLPLFSIAFAIQGILGLALAGHQGILQAIISLALLAISCALLAATRRIPFASDGKPRSHAAILDLRSEAGRNLMGPWLCMLVCQFVVGFANTAVFNSSSASMLAGVDVNLCVLAAVALVAIAYAILHRSPTPETMFKVVLPTLLGVFSVSALATDALGVFAGYAMICSYEAIALVYSVFLVQFLHAGQYEPYYHVGMTAGISNIVLVLGFAVGIALNTLWSTHGIPLLTLVAFVAIYPLGLVLMVVQRNRSQAEQAAATRSLVDEAREERNRAVQEAREAGRADAHEAEAGHLADFAERHGLTPREADVCGFLVRGYAVRVLAEELGITENTAWTHARSIYAKCGVSSKQDLIELFEVDRNR